MQTIHLALSPRLAQAVREAVKQHLDTEAFLDDELCEEVGPDQAEQLLTSVVEYLDEFEAQVEEATTNIPSPTFDHAKSIADKMAKAANKAVSA